MPIIDIHPHVIATDNVRYPLQPLGGNQSTWSRNRPTPYEKMIEEMDVPRAEVMIEAKLVQITANYLDQMGVRFSPDGATLAAGCDDRTVRLWDLELRNRRVLNTTETTLEFDIEQWVQRIAYSEDGRWIAAGGPLRVRRQGRTRGAFTDREPLRGDRRQPVRAASRARRRRVRQLSCSRGVVP